MSETYGDAMRLKLNMMECTCINCWHLNFKPMSEIGGGVAGIYSSSESVGCTSGLWSILFLMSNALCYSKICGVV